MFVLELFNDDVKFCNLGFSIGKSVDNGFSEIIAAFHLKVGRVRANQITNGVNEGM